jgi:O-antigen ligase
MTFMVRETRPSRRIWYAIALILDIAGCVATQEKTAIILLVVVIAGTVAYRPRRYAAYWPLLIVAVIAVRVAAPHSISALIYQFKTLGNSSSTTGRTSDYPATAPFIATHLLFGRGFGSYAPQKYRILDDQMLGNLIQLGVVGLLSYWAMILLPIRVVHRAARRGLSLRDVLMGGLAIDCFMFFTSNFLYDTFSFRQGPYVFFFLAALAAAGYGTVATEREPPDPPEITAPPGALLAEP